ncbi:MAG: class I SAM-dependent methyltransferase [Acidimicrobiales bacterium]
MTSNARPGEVVEEACTLCGAAPLTVVGVVPGYLAGRSYTVLECDGCGSQAVPADTVVPDGLYDAIYRNAERLPGYARYGRYADAVASVRDPLYYLSHSEDVYWAVATVLAERRRAGLGTTVVDVGSGLGYLTAALRGAGYEAWGLDLSEEAVARANRRFGDWYRQGDAMDVADATNIRPDVIVALELIEHVHEPVGLLAAMASQVADGGEVIVSTPNRTRLPSDRLYETDAPPVHLRWITEPGLRELGRRASCSVDLVDFTAFNRMMARPSGVPVGRPATRDVAPLDEELHLTGAPVPTTAIGRRDRLVRSRRAAPLVAAVRVARRLRHRGDADGRDAESAARSASAVARFAPLP